MLSPSAHMNDSQRSLRMMRDPSVIQILENHKVKGETSINGSEGKMQIREKRLQNSVGIVKKQTNKQKHHSVK